MLSPDPTRRSFGELRGSGLLWLINRAVLHPRGFALALHYDSDDEDHSDPVGWSLLGDGSEPWRFDGDEDDTFAAVEGMFAAARTTSPPDAVLDPEVQPVEGAPEEDKPEAE